MPYIGTILNVGSTAVFLPIWGQKYSIMWESYSSTPSPPQKNIVPTKFTKCVISSFRRGVNKISAPLGFYAA
jgi:hypothetical protein